MSEPAARGGFRGYIASRPVAGIAFPQRLQNIAVREYAARTGLVYKLSATEYAMPGCYMMLAATLDELTTLDGIICFSCFMLPQRKARRLEVYQRVLAGGSQLHTALENLPLRREPDIERWENLIDVAAVLPATPFGGRYEKNAEPLDAALARLMSA